MTSAKTTNNAKHNNKKTKRLDDDGANPSIESEGAQSRVLDPTEHGDIEAPHGMVNPIGADVIDPVIGAGAASIAGAGMAPFMDVEAAAMMGVDTGFGGDMGFIPDGDSQAAHSDEESDDTHKNDRDGKPTHASRGGGGGIGGSFSRPLRILFLYLIPALLVTALVITGVWGSRQQALAEGYKTTTESVYRQAYTELTDSVYALQIMLSKLMVSESPSTLTFTLDDIWRESGVCVGLMGQIPQSHIDNYQLNQFLVRIGDYARSLSKSVLRGTPISDEDRQQLASLYDASIKIHQELQSVLDSGGIPVESIRAEDFFASSNDAEYDPTDQVDSQYPTLIYDGPFSESTEKQEARGLTGEEVDEAAALTAAYSILGDSTAELYLSSVSDGRIPSYDFEGTLTDGRRVDISITVQGGHLLWMMSSATESFAHTPDEAEVGRLSDAGESWLLAQGFGNVAPTYAQYYDGAVLISYAAVQDDVLLYNDLIKVWLDRATGTVVGADARNYRFSHVERELSTERLDEDAVRGYLSPNLNVIEVNLALVPATSQTEVLCYEFKGTLGNDEYIVYLDTATGEEVQIFRIISDESGQLAI